MRRERLAQAAEGAALNGSAKLLGRVVSPSAASTETAIRRQGSILPCDPLPENWTVQS